VAMVTLAPELTGSGPVIAHLVREGVVVSAGHTAAAVEELEPAIEAGVRYVTHLFNAMAPLGHREPGPVAVALADHRLTVGLIVDGLHVHPWAVAAAWSALGPDRCNLVTDAMAALGRPHGRFVLGSREVTFGPDGVRLPDGTLAGSALALDEAVRNLVAFTACAVHEAVATVTATPARLLGLDRRGRIHAGADADLTLLTPELHAVGTVVGGTVVGGRQAVRPEEVPAWRS
jgi:N-acetylglucosamine-6-phosphate deacetylase